MKALKIAAIGLVTLVAVVVLLLFVGVPAGFLVGPIQSRVEAATGHQLKISGATTLTILPAPSLVLHGVSLLDPRGGAAQTGATVESVRIEATLPGLFKDRPQISEVILVRPVFRSLLLRQRTVPAATPPAPARSGDAATAARPVTVDHFAIHEGTLAFVNGRGTIESKLERIDLIGSLGADDQLDVIVSGLAGTQVLRVKVRGKAPQGGFDGSPIPVEFGFEAPGLLQGALSGSAEVRPVGKLIQVNSVTGTIGPNKFSGWAAIDVASKPLVKVDLDFQKLDLGTVYAPGAGTGAAAGSNIDKPWSNTPISLDGLNYFDAEIQLSAAALNIETFHFAPISMSANLTNGVVRATLPSMGLYGGLANNGIAIDASGDEPTFALRSEIAGVRALPLLTDVANFTKVDGRMQASVDLRARGASERAIVASLDGTLDVQLQDGEIRSINIAQMIRNVGASVLSGWQAGQSEKTDFTQFGGLFRFDRGVASTTNLQLAGPLVRVTGTGSADLNAKTLQFKLEPKLVLSLEGQGSTANPVGLGVPVVVQGPWSAPKIYPEIAGMLENPDAAFAKLQELGLGLFGPSAGGKPNSGQQLMQGIGDMIKNFGTGQQPPAANPPPASQPPAPRR